MYMSRAWFRFTELWWARFRYLATSESSKIGFGFNLKGNNQRATCQVSKKSLVSSYVTICNLGGKVVNCLATLVHHLLSLLAQPTLDTVSNFWAKKRGRSWSRSEVLTSSILLLPHTALVTEKKILLLLLLLTSRGPFTTFFFFLSNFVNLNFQC